MTESEYAQFCADNRKVLESEPHRHNRRGVDYSCWHCPDYTDTPNQDQLDKLDIERMDYEMG